MFYGKGCRQAADSKCSLFLMWWRSQAYGNPYHDDLAAHRNCIWLNIHCTRADFLFVRRMAQKIKLESYLGTLPSAMPKVWMVSMAL